MTRPGTTKPAQSAKAARRDGANAGTAHALQPVIEAVRAVILEADDRIKEGVKWNAPSFYTTEHFATFHLRSSTRVQLVLHLGAKPRAGVTVRNAIAESSVPLEWRGPDRAIVTFATVAEVRRHRAAFTRLVQQWIEHV